MRKFLILLPIISMLFSSTYDITYSSDEDIYGFQFNVEGASLSGASGGAAAAAGFTV